jgi:hypothetical protein
MPLPFLSYLPISYFYILICVFLSPFIYFLSSLHSAFLCVDLTGVQFYSLAFSIA